MSRGMLLSDRNIKKTKNYKTPLFEKLTISFQDFDKIMSFLTKIYSFNIYGSTKVILKILKSMKKHYYRTQFHKNPNYELTNLINWYLVNGPKFVNNIESDIHKFFKDNVNNELLTIIKINIIYNNKLNK